MLQVEGHPGMLLVGLCGAALPPKLLPRHDLGGTWATGNSCGVVPQLYKNNLRPFERSIKTEMKCDINTEAFLWPKKEASVCTPCIAF